MTEPASPTDRVIPRYALPQGRSLGRMLILLGALLVLTAAPLSSAEGAARPASAGSPARIAFGAYYVDDTFRGQILTLRADGRGGVNQLIPGMHNDEFCQSADGRKIAYYSDQEAPHEQFIYLANANGTDAQKITEKPVGFLCPFSERWLLLTKQGPGATTLVRHDLQSGAETTVLSTVDRYSLSPDGSKLLFVGGLDFTPGPGQRPKGNETLELVDLRTLETRLIAGPLPRAKSYGLFGSGCGCTGAWSPDGRRIAYTIGPSFYADLGRAGRPPAGAYPYALYVRPASGREARLVLGFSGGPPSISWSADDRRLLVCAQSRGRSNGTGLDAGCGGGAPRRNGTYSRPEFAGKLMLVDLAHRSVRRVASGKKLLFAQWAPSGTTYAYATTAAAYLARPGGARRKLALASGLHRHWPGGGWMGWSPDGRYIGLGFFSKHLAVLNAATGQVRVLFTDQKEFLILSPRWWR
jgi:WD40-like Beta Propeller Repeat